MGKRKQVQDLDQQEPELAESSSEESSNEDVVEFPRAIQISIVDSQ